ncbi:hypothetical protein CEXT_237761 [Caerostris extrusa]|uniref:Uncharacterized protein n=1 Tax=Caerostris extrusa TaxID=172846 RepID=A0AAV4UWS3_CAEEX|nr:hypothetical protein CEXT_237761 [Caerostris extrusa]
MSSTICSSPADEDQECAGKASVTRKFLQMKGVRRDPLYLQRETRSLSLKSFRVDTSVSILLWAHQSEPQIKSIHLRERNWKMVAFERICWNHMVGIKRGGTLVPLEVAPSALQLS